MRKSLRRTLVAGGLSLFALVPVGVASAAVQQGDQAHRTATEVTTTARQQDRQRLHQQDRQHQQVGLQDQDQERQRLRDGSCGDGAARTGTAAGVSVTSTGGQHRSGALDGTRSAAAPLDGTGNQWHAWQLN